jgi:superfamily I DNA/RNA helicase
MLYRLREGEVRKVIITEAVPGAGKTESIVKMINDNLAEGKSPESIYAVTFTREAAGSLSTRTGGKVNSSTIHSLAYKIVYGTDMPDNEYGEFSYDELLDKAITITKSENFTNEIKISLLAIDEAQDLTPIQYSFLSNLSECAETTYLVGDNMQSIYGFNLSDPNLMHLFGKRSNVELQNIHMLKSWRVPGAISDYVNECFAPRNRIDASGNMPGLFNFIKSKKSEVYNVAASLVDDGEHAILMRTNREVLTFIKRSDVSDLVSAVLPVSVHPVVSMMYTITRMNTLINLHELINLSWIVGGFSWTTRNMLKMFGGYVMDREMMEKVFSPTHHKGVADGLPPVVPHNRSEVYMLLQELDEYKEFYGTRSHQSMYDLYNQIIDRVYNIEDFWRNSAMSVDDIINAAHRLISSGTDSYINSNPNAKTRVMTMHSSKGLEFEKVTCVINGSVINIYEPEEFRVLYVACTRSRNILNVISPMDIKRSKEKRNIIDTLNPNEDIL